MILNFNKKFDRWLTDAHVILDNIGSFPAKITIKDLNGMPDPKGFEEINTFFDFTDIYRGAIIKKLFELNPDNSVSQLKEAIISPVFLYSPALVGNMHYELMAVIDLNSVSIHKQSCIFCFNNRTLSFSEKIIE